MDIMPSEIINDMCADYVEYVYASKNDPENEREENRIIVCGRDLRKKVR